MKDQENQLKKENEAIKQRIESNNQVGFGDVCRVGMQGAVIGGSIRFALKLYSKHKEGKNIYKGELTLDDWREIGLDAGKGAMLSGFSAMAIYGLTNFTQMSAPFAGAFVRPP